MSTEGKNAVGVILTLVFGIALVIGLFIADDIWSPTMPITSERTYSQCLNDIPSWLGGDAQKQATIDCARLTSSGTTTRP